MRLWDRDGRLWTVAGDALDREATQRLYRNMDVQVAVAEGAVASPG